MPTNPAPFSSFAFVLSLNDQPIAGFTEASGVVHRKIPGVHKTSDVTLKRGVIKASALDQWINSVRNAPTASQPTLTLIQRDERHATVATWRLIRGYPLKYTGPALNGKATDVAIEELVLSSESIEWIPPC